MSRQAHIGHVLGELKKDMEKAAPLKEKKNVLTAAVVGFLFGPIGIGIYMGSWRDFFTCLIVLVLLLFTVALAPIGWIFSAVYGGYRVWTSNQNLNS